MLETKKELKEAFIRIRVTEQEKEMIKEAATKKGLSITDLIKICVNEYFKVETLNENKLIEGWFFTKTVQQEIHGDADLYNLIECTQEIESTGFNEWLVNNNLCQEFNEWLKKQNLEQFYDVN